MNVIARENKDIDIRERKGTEILFKPKKGCFNNSIKIKNK